jgi:hypothetical protein
VNAAAAAPALMREAIERFGAARLRAFGGSMAPAIRPGDLLHVQWRPAAAIRPGDVVLFERDGRLFAHRVVRCRGNGTIQTRGDSHLHSDPPLATRQVLGVVYALTRDGHRLDCPRATCALGAIGRGLARRLRGLIERRRTPSDRRSRIPA